MVRRGKPGPLRPSLQALLLGALGAAILLPSLPLRDLWNPDEPRYAEVAREMLELGDGDAPDPHRDRSPLHFWLVPHLNGEVYSEKPPLFFWLSAAGQASGLGFHAGRVVAGLASLGTLLLAWATARRFLPDRAALLGAAALATTELFQMIGRAGVLDMPLTFFVTLAAYGWFRGRVILFYAGMGLAVLTKGPVGIVVAALAALSAAAAERRRGWPRHLLWGPLLTAAIVLAWLVPACLSGGPAYRDAILIKQNVGRMVESWSHARPFWYYVPYLAGTFFPWILFVPFAVLRAWRQGGFPRALVLWVALGFLFFSALSGKRERYLLPLFPPLAILVGAWLDGAADALARAWPRRAARFAHLFFMGAGVGLFAAALVGPHLPRAVGLFRDHLGVAIRDPDGEVAAALGGLAKVPGLLGTAASAAALWLLGRRGLAAVRAGLLPRAAAFIVLQVVVLFLAWDLLLVPRVNEFKSPRQVAEELNRWPGEVAAFPGHFAGAYNLYSGRLTIPVLDTPEEVASHLSAEGPRLVLTSREAYERPRKGESRSLRDALAVPHHASLRARVGHREMLFLTNYPPPPGAPGGG